MRPEITMNPDRLGLSGQITAVRPFSFFKPLLVALSLLFITACSGSSSDGGPTAGGEPTEAQRVGGNATKGPLANAAVTVFALDPGASDLQGAEIASGSTNAEAQIEVELPNTTEGLLLVVVTATENTTDLTTGQSPVISTMSTVADAEQWLGGQAVYATPLSHMAVQIASRNIGGTADISPARIRSALARAQAVVRNTVGFGLLGGTDNPIDLFKTPPVLTNEATEPADRQRTLQYRKAAEAIAAVVADLAGSTDAEQIQTLFDSITDDLADGVINEGNLAADLAAVDPENLTIPNATGDRTVADTFTILNDEKTSVGVNNDEVGDLGAQDDSPSQPVVADSGLNSEQLAGEVAELTLAISPAAGGIVGLEGEDQSASGSFELGLGETVAVTATAAEGYAFARWSDTGTEASTDKVYSFTFEQATTLTAEFAAGVSVRADPVTGGTQSASQPFFEPGQEVTVTAASATGFTFLAWVNSEGPLPDGFAQGEDQQTTATFTMPDTPVVLTALYSFTAFAEPDPQQGEVSSRFDEDGNVLLTANPQPGFIFTQWVNETGTVLSTQREDFAVALDDLTTETQISAEFEQAPAETAVWGQFNWGEAVWQ